MTMHIFKSRQQGKPAPSQEPATGRQCGRREPKSIRDDIDRLCVSSCKGLWGLIIFLAASIIAFYGSDPGLAGGLALAIRELLGPAPPLILVHIIMGVSIFCSLILIGGRICKGLEPGSTWTHLFFRLIFYPVYFVTDSLADYYHVVFISGLCILALQYYNIWSYAGRAIDVKMTAGDALAVWLKKVSGK